MAIPKLEKDKARGKIDWAVVGILVLAASLRFFLLDLRPTHHDEGIVGWFADQITANGFYQYDPRNYHGPLTYYIVFLFQALFGRNLWVLRIPTVLFNLLSIYWIFLFKRYFGQTTCLIAALAMALSPAYLYFARYISLELHLVFFTILTFWGIIGLWDEGTRKYLWAVGLGITGMILTKETYIISLICFILAWICLILWEKVSPSKQNKKAEQLWNSKDLYLVITSCTLLIIFFYSGTFFSMKGVLGLLETFKIWFTTGTQQGGHEKPFFYWVNLFYRYEYLALVGFIGCLFYVKTSSKWIRYTAIYGLGILLVYSIIPYKTPWCIVNLLWPFYFVFGDIVNQLLKTKWQLGIQILCVLLFLISGLLTCVLNFIDHSNPRMPYVYVQTFPDIKKLTDPIFKLVKNNPDGYNLTGNVLRQDEWPLPWILGEFTMIGYYGLNIKPIKYDADFLFVETKRIDEVEKNLQNQYFTDIFTLRDAQEPSKLYLKYERFKDIFPGRKPEFIK